MLSRVIVIAATALASTALAQVHDAGVPTAELDAGADAAPEAAPLLDAAPPGKTAAIAPPPPPAQRCDTVGFALDASVFVAKRLRTSEQAGVPPADPGLPLLHRLSAGLVYRLCDASDINLRFGAVAHVAGRALTPFTYGLEAEVNRRVATDFRIGLRIGAERAENEGNLADTFLAGGVRLRFQDRYTAGIEAFRANNHGHPLSYGVMFGVGVEGKPVLAVIAVEAVVLLLFALSGD